MGEWKKVKLGEICSLITKGATPRGEYQVANSKEAVAFIRAENVNGTTICRSELKCIDSSIHQRELKRSQLKDGDILITIAGAIGRTAMVDCSILPANINQAVAIIRLDTADFDRRFVLDYLRLPVLREELTAISSGQSVQANLNLHQVGEIEIPCPPLPTQRRIAAVLGALDDKIEVNRKICENLEAQAQALFKGMKRRAEESSFVQVIDILSGGTPKTSVPEYWNGDIPFFSPKDVGGLFTISTERNITDQGLANCNSILYPKGTTFVTARGTVGKVCLAGVPMAMNQSCFALASNEIDPLLVYFYTCASVDSLKSKANGSVFAAITIAEFETEKIHRLTDSEEERFVKTVRPMFDQILVRQQESRALAAMRDALLPKLMSGELSVEKVEG